MLIKKKKTVRIFMLSSSQDIKELKWETGIEGGGGGGIGRL